MRSDDKPPCVARKTPQYGGGFAAGAVIGAAVGAAAITTAAYYNQYPTGVYYRPENYLSDMDAGFYSADYLRAWIRHAQLRSYLAQEVGEDWWRSPATGEILRNLFAEGTRPTSEEIAARLDQPHGGRFLKK